MNHIFLMAMVFAAWLGLSACGGAGCALRVAARDALVRRGTHPWWSTCLVNLSGAMAMGLVSGAAAATDPVLGPMAATACAGLLAGWTTYSAFAMDVVQLWWRGDRARAAAIWMATMLGCPMLAWVGAWAVRAAIGGGS